MEPEQDSNDKQPTRISVLLVHQDNAFAAWFDKEFKHVFDLKILSNPNNAIPLLKEGYQPQIIVGDVVYGKKTGVNFYIQAKFYSSASIRVVFSKDLDDRFIEEFNARSAAHRFIKLPLPAADIRYQLKSIIEQFIPQKRSKATLQALLFPEREANSADDDADDEIVDDAEAHDRDGLLEGEFDDDGIDDLDMTETKVIPPFVSPFKPRKVVADNAGRRQAVNNLKKTVSELNLNVVPSTMQSLIYLLCGLQPEMHRYHMNNHAQGVSEIATALAQTMRLPDSSVGTIRLAALLHDCGKVGMDERVLSFSPDILAENDKTVYASHVKRGLSMLKGIEGLEDVRKIIAQHHENHDGSGFPEKLEGPQILIEAMILHLADEYHNRVYRLPSYAKTSGSVQPNGNATKKLTLEYRQSQALSLLNNHKHRFKPEVLDALNELAKNGTCSLVGLGTPDTGHNPQLVDDIARKYAK